MKFWIVLLLLGTAVCVKAQSAEIPGLEFVEFLLNIQNEIEPYHQQMEEALRDARNTVNQVLTVINDDCVNQITDALGSVVNIRDYTNELVNNSTGNAECIMNALRTWDTDIEVAGDNISTCVGNNMDILENTTQAISEMIRDRTRDSFNIQNLVVNTMADLNPVTEYEDIRVLVNSRINEIWEEWTSITSLELSELITDLMDLRYLIPEEIHHCLEKTIIDFSDTAAAIRSTVELC